MPKATTKHTPGPWNVESWVYKTAGRENVPTITTAYDAIAEASPLWCPDDREDEREEERAANARLIAAAPDLLRAALAVLSDLEHYVSTHGPGPDDRLDALKDAVYKAEKA